jgi:lipid-A-disaccharide synthase
MQDINFGSPIFICAGEPSGDLYAGFLARYLKKKFPGIKMYGVGGDSMRKSGVSIIEDYHRLMTFGFSTGISAYLRNYMAYREIAHQLYKLRPNGFVAVAYPGMNLPLCRYAKKLECTIYYFLPPQIWAWGEFRRYFIKKWVDTVISVFPFECEFYRKKGVKVEYFENPLFAELKRYKRNDFQKRIGFMPGSRQGGIERNLRSMVEIMGLIGQKRTRIVFEIILQSREMLTKRWFAGILGMMKNSLVNSIEIVTENQYQAMKNCDLLILSSGTASLEAAAMRIPQIFVHRPPFFDFYAMRRFLRIKEYNLTNLYFGKEIVPSYVNYNIHSVLPHVYELIETHLSN